MEYFDNSITNVIFTEEVSDGRWKKAIIDRGGAIQFTSFFMAVLLSSTQKKDKTYVGKQRHGDYISMDYVHAIKHSPSINQ